MPGEGITPFTTTNFLKGTAKRETKDQLGQGWQVFEIGEKLGKHGGTVSLDHDCPLYSGSYDPLRTIVAVVAYIDDFCTIAARPNTTLVKIHRLILREIHEKRRHHLGTTRGRVLKALNATSRWLFTSTLIVNQLSDICGLIDHLSRSWWHEDVDRNRGPLYLAHVGAERAGKLRSTTISHPEADGAEQDEGEAWKWEDYCEPVDGLQDEEVQHKVNRDG